MYPRTPLEKLSHIPWDPCEAHFGNYCFRGEKGNSDTYKLQ
jgi:hypothetical protein